MKRFLIVLLSVLLIFTVACNDSGPDRLSEGSVKFTAENLPSVAVTPLTEDMGVNLVMAVLGCDRDEALNVLTVCDTTDECYRMLIDGECDIVIAHIYGQSIVEKLNTTALTLTETELQRDALVFVTNGKTGVTSLSAEQIASVYKAEVTDWQELGGEESAVTLFGEPSGTAVHNAFEKYISSEIQVPDVVKTVQTENGTFSTAIGYDNRDGAIGYTLLSLAGNYNGGSIKPMELDGVAPSKAAVESKEYQFSVPVNVVIRASEPAGQNTRVLYDWIISEQGRAAVGNLY